MSEASQRDLLAEAHEEIERLRAIAEQRGEFLFRIMEICREYDSQLAQLAADRAGQ